MSATNKEVHEHYKPQTPMTMKQTLELFVLQWNSNADVTYKDFKEGDKDNVLIALSRQVPMKLVLTGKTKRCPTCNKYVTNYKKSRLDHYYCYHCGQKFDWSDTVDYEHRGIGI